MKKAVVTFVVVTGFLFSWALDLRNTAIINQQQLAIQTLRSNEVQLLTTVIYLTEKMTNMVDVIQEKSEWDKQVATKIRELDSIVKERDKWKTNTNMP